MSILYFLREVTNQLEKQGVNNNAELFKKRFYEEDLGFIVGLITDPNPADVVVSVFAYLADIHGIPTGLATPIWLRRLKFFKHYIFDGCNATQAAIKCGYSPHSAGKQGYRLVKKSSEICRESIMVECVE